MRLTIAAGPPAMLRQAALVGFLTAAILAGSPAHAQIPPLKRATYGDWTYNLYSRTDHDRTVTYCALEAGTADDAWHIRFVYTEKFGFTLLLVYPMPGALLKPGDAIVLKSALTEEPGIVDVVFTTETEGAVRLTKLSAKAVQAMLSATDTVALLPPGMGKVVIPVKGLQAGVKAVDGCTDRPL